MNKLEIIKQVNELVEKQMYYEKKLKKIKKRRERIIRQCNHGIIIFHGSTVTTHVAECLFCGADQSCYDILKNAKNIIDMAGYVEGDPLLAYDMNCLRVKKAYETICTKKPDITDEEAVKKIDKLLTKEM